MSSYCDKMANRSEKINDIICLASYINFFSRPHPLISFHYNSQDKIFILEIIHSKPNVIIKVYQVHLDDSRSLQKLSNIHKRLRNIYINL